MISKVKRFGVLTSGGDAPGLNAVIRSLCRTASREYEMQAVGIRNGYRGLIDGDMLELTEKDISGLLTKGGTFLGSSRTKPFKNPERDPKTGLLPIEAIKKNFKKWKLDALVCIGGNGTNTTASLLFDEGLPVIGLPKTIDNDIEGTDESFGFHTALDVATEGIDRIHTTACSHGRCMIVEVMGHKAGWLGLYAGVAGGADVILIPEIPYDIKHVVKKIDDRKKAGASFSIIVVAEGAKSREESFMTKKDFKKSRAEMTSSIGFRVAKEIADFTGEEEPRVSVLGYLQRGGSPSSSDRLLASRIGSATASFLNEGKFGFLVALQGGNIKAVPLSDVAGKVKNIPLNHPVIKTARGLGIGFGDNL